MYEALVPATEEGAEAEAVTEVLEVESYTENLNSSWLHEELHKTRNWASALLPTILIITSYKRLPAEEREREREREREPLRG